MKKVLCWLLVSLPMLLTAQESTTKEGARSPFSVTGFIQADFAYGEKQAKLTVGQPRRNDESDFCRFGIPRARAKVSYTTPQTEAVLQLNGNEKELILLEAYITLSPKITPWLKARGGLYLIDFGEESRYSSANLETPTRSLITQTLFPGQRVIGASLYFNPTTDNLLKDFTLTASIVGNSGRKQDPSNQKDLIARLKYQPTISSTQKLVAGISLYWGGAIQNNATYYTVKDGEYQEITTHIGNHIHRIYYGIDLSYHFNTTWGKTDFRGEYIMGQQPASATQTISNEILDAQSHHYLRPFSGGFIYGVQQIARSAHSIVIRYDYYDPNTALNGEKISKATFRNTQAENAASALHYSAADIALQNITIGYLYTYSKNLRFDLSYQIKYNEKVAEWEKNAPTPTLSIYAKDLNDNIFTARVRYAF